MPPSENSTAVKVSSSSNSSSSTDDDDNNNNHHTYKMTSNILARDVSYEDAAPISDGNSLGSGEVLCQGCIKLRQELYQASTNVKSVEEITRILHDEINMSRMVDATDRGESSLPCGKKQISSKTYFKDWTQILVINIRSLKICKELI